MHRLQSKRQVKSMELNCDSFEFDKAKPLHYHLHSYQPIKSKPKYHKSSMPKTLRRHKSSILDIFTCKYLLTVGVIGGLSGVAAGILQ